MERPINVAKKIERPMSCVPSKLIFKLTKKKSATFCYYAILSSMKVAIFFVLKSKWKSMSIKSMDILSRFAICVL